MYYIHIALISLTRCLAELPIGYYKKCRQPEHAEEVTDREIKKSHKVPRQITNKFLT